MKHGSWLACALTLGNLLCGLASILLAAQGLGQTSYFRPVPAEAFHAAWLIFLGMVLDGLDGRVARMTRADGAFGAQLDSLADVVTFGVAPAVLAWVVGVRAEAAPQNVLWAASALFASAAALRLARYNVQHLISTPRGYRGHRNPDFTGLPSPAAAGLVASFVLLLEEPPLTSLASLLPAALAGAGVLMVSRVPYVHALKRMGRAGRFGPAAWAFGALLAACATVYPAPVLATSLLAYALAGPVWQFVAPMFPAPAEEDVEVADEPRR